MKKVFIKYRNIIISFMVGLISSIFVYIVVKNNQNSIVKREQKIKKIDKKVEKWLKKYGDI